METLLLIFGAMLLLSVVASKISDNFGVPVLILFLTIGMLAGSDGIGKIYFDDPALTNALSTIALTFILFSGGFETNLKDIKPIYLSGLSLSTLGVLISALLVGLFASLVLKFSMEEGFLLGAIVASTDAAAVFNVLRTNKVSLRGHLQPLLEFESGSNDPMAVFLTVGIIGLLKDPGLSPLQLLPRFFIDMGIGAAAAVVLARVGIFIINRLRLSLSGLYPALIIALVLSIYSATQIIKGNGFLAVYIAGILIGNANLLHKRTIKNFSDGIAWLMQIIMFLTLGLLAFPSQIVPVAVTGLLVSAFLIFAARPAAVFISLAGSKLNIAEKMLVSWVGLRGAVPIILATFPLMAHIPKAEIIFNIVFFIVLTSSLLQGTTLSLVAKYLKVAAPLKNRQASLEFGNGETDAGLEDLIVPYNSPASGRPLYKLDIPKGCLIALISRNDKSFVPNGQTVIEEGDVLLVIANKQDLQKLQSILNKT
ncbi:MAG: potassium/proton antiporter [Candidatus Omnitrophica bacterium]|nr:potassium/proton antiporter [Candidatus Omnitrophota bacterium]MDE2222171.1 potassium/proton antiporter [Candidatus Omnitrophota bacterium]